MALPHVAIIILNWNGRDDTLACLKSLSRLNYPAHFVIVVDNGSSDGSARAIQLAFPHVTVIEAGCNLGYVGGNNLGLEHARARGAHYALLLNNDTEVASDFLRLLVEAATEPAVGIVGPIIYYQAQPRVIWSAGGAIDWKRGRTCMIGEGEEDRGQFSATRPVDFVTGCALLIKMSVVERIGPLDPRFFAYYEETEWCVRAARAGYKVMHVPRAKVWHKISLAARDTSIGVTYYMTRNRLLFLKLTRAGLVPWLYTLFLDYGRTLMSYTVRPEWRHKRVARKIMWEAIRDYWRQRFGQMPTALQKII